MTGHWRRFLLQLGIGASMLAVNAISENLFLVIVSISILVLPVIVWSVFGILSWLSSQAPDIRTLSERVDDMLTLGIASTVGALIAGLTLARLTGLIEQPVGSLVTVGLGYIVVAVSIPALTLLKTVRDVWLPMIRERS